MNQVQAERCLLLADHLEKNVKEEEFDLEFYAQKTECGTVCCALGHAGLMPDFRAQGFTTSIAVSNAHFGGVRFGDNYGLTAAMKFFGMTHRQVQDTFYDKEIYDWHATPTKVAARIRECVNAASIERSEP